MTPTALRALRTLPPERWPDGAALRVVDLALSVTRQRRHRRNDIATMQLRAQAREINGLREELRRRG